MRLIKILKFIATAKHPHFISIDDKTYLKWKFLIKLAMTVNPRYKTCEIFRKKYKSMRNIVVIGLKWNGKNVKRRTSGFAKEFVQKNQSANCIYCGVKLSEHNATADHIIPISKGGNNAQINIVVCCRDCNNERSDTNFDLYFRNKNNKYKNKKYIYI